MPTTIFDSIGEPLAQRVTVGLAKIALSLKTRSWKAAGRRGVTPTQAQVLALLRARRDTGARLSTVADGLGVTRPTASDAVTVLVRKGLVRKDKAPDDGRAVALYLTAAGAAKAVETADWPDALLGAIEVLSAAEQGVFLRSLVKMIHGLQQRGDIAVSEMCLTCRYFRAYAHDDADEPHHCAYVDAPMGDRHLRLDCREHAPAPAALHQKNWAHFTEARPLDRAG